MSHVPENAKGKEQKLVVDCSAVNNLKTPIRNIFCFTQFREGERRSLESTFTGLLWLESYELVWIFLSEMYTGFSLALLNRYSICR